MRNKSDWNYYFSPSNRIDIYFCLFIASATFCSPLYIIPPPTMNPTNIITPTIIYAISVSISLPPLYTITQQLLINKNSVIFRMVVSFVALLLADYDVNNKK